MIDMITDMIYVKGSSLLRSFSYEIKYLINKGEKTLQEEIDSMKEGGEKGEGHYLSALALQEVQTSPVSKIKA